MTKTNAQSVIAAFDFDGTITTKDTFLAFLYRAFGKPRVYAALAALSWHGLLVWLGLASRDRFKELLVARLFVGVSVQRLQAIGVEHAQYIYSLCRPQAIERIRWHQQQGHHLVMVSASLDFYLAPIAQRLGFDDLLCTRLEAESGLCTGRLQGQNCRAAVKVSCLRELFADLDSYLLYAYGDSAGDAELLAQADVSSYKPFR